jgi:hypothetical protein
MDTVREALQKASKALPNLVVPDSVIEDSKDLEQYEPAHQERWAIRAFEALRSLHRYVDAKHRPVKPFRGNFYTFTTMTDEATITPAVVKLGESTMLMGNKRLADMRRFPVDRRIDPTGACSMASHIVLQHRGFPAPRMYFLDGSMGPTWSIHIGYAGKHLENMVTPRM